MQLVDPVGVGWGAGSASLPLLYCKRTTIQTSCSANDNTVSMLSLVILAISSWLIVGFSSVLCFKFVMISKFQNRSPLDANGPLQVTWPRVPAPTFTTSDFVYNIRNGESAASGGGNSRTANIDVSSIEIKPLVEVLSLI